jgi:hypothetical protein
MKDQKEKNHTKSNQATFWDVLINKAYLTIQERVTKVNSQNE